MTSKYDKQMSTVEMKWFPRPQPNVTIDSHKQIVDAGKIQCSAGNRKELLNIDLLLLVNLKLNGKQTTGISLFFLETIRVIIRVNSRYCCPYC